MLGGDVMTSTNLSAVRGVGGAIPTALVPASLQDTWPALVVGGGLVVLGAFFMWTHVRSWQRTQRDLELDGRGRQHYRTQFRRRMQTSAMIVLIGLLIPLGDALIPWRKAPTLFFFYWGGILLMAIWVMVQALGDMFSTREYSRGNMEELRRQQAELERELEQFRESVTRNGRDLENSR